MTTETTVILVGFVGIVLLGIYKRFRRYVRRQPVNWRFAVRAVVLAAITLFLIVFSVYALVLGNPLVFVGSTVGLVVGFALGILGVRLATFERTPAGIDIVPNRYLNTGVFALFIVRLVVRFAAAVSFFESILASCNSQRRCLLHARHALGTHASSVAPTVRLVHSPSVLAVFGVFLAYFLTYYTAALYVRWIVI